MTGPLNAGLEVDPISLRDTLRVTVEAGSFGTAGSLSFATGVPVLPVVDGTGGAFLFLTVLAVGSHATRNSITCPVVAGSALTISAMPPKGASGPRLSS
ncbi:MAG: hypothetical protein ACK6D5_02060 [Planctomyces sp.]